MRATSTLDGSIYTTDISGRNQGKDEGIIAKYVYAVSGYQRTANPDGGVNTEASEAHPFIAPDESYIIFDALDPMERARVIYTFAIALPMVVGARLSTARF